MGEPGGVFIVALFAILLAKYPYAMAGFTDSDWDCDKPCPKAYKPVCGEDDIEYQNACIAVCQGVAVRMYEQCLDLLDEKGNVLRKRGRPAPHHRVSAGTVDKAAMGRFAREGFKYVGHQHVSKDKADLTKAEPMQLQEVTEADINKHHVPYHRAVRASRLTDDGHIYEQVVNEDEAHAMLKKLTEQGQAHVPHEPPPKATASSRKLKQLNTTNLYGGDHGAGPHTNGRKLNAVVSIFGADDRFRLGSGAGRGTATHIYFNTPAGTSMCSAVFIKSTAIMTAGHCASNGQGLYYSGYQIIAAHECDWVVGNDCWIESRPTGTVAAKYVNTFSAYLNYGDLNWDIAVITTSPGGGVGGTGFGYFCGLRNVRVGTVGWPGDKPSATRWGQVQTMSNDQCKAPYDQGHYFDAAGGQSGSGMWNDDGSPPDKVYVQWILNAVSVGYKNWAVAIGPHNFNQLVAWYNLV